MESRFCHNCGNAIGVDERFCGRCGALAPGEQQTYVWVRPKIPGRGLGISAMVLGIIGLVYSLPAVFAATQGQSSMAALCILSVLALIFGSVAFGKKYQNGVSISGVIMGVIGIVVYIVAFIVAMCQ